ncbi:DinB family protein [Arthrobacter sp. Leaf69]|uniref:DinB family protein n=1 Tax=Arthrobacter sp. Leaf69 TaxID=1736232 RepID=UPI000ACD1B7F|nr:DinB family protein [Arthrobacter sp. Leaf69]
MTDPLDREAVADAYRRNCMDVETTLALMSPEELHRRSAGTRWTNEELLYHMVFGYIVVLALLPLVRIFGRLPDSVNRGFAGLLNAGTVPFDIINDWGSKGGARIFNRRRMAAKLRRVTSALERRLRRETEAGLACRMHFPTRWDPFFKESMTLADVYTYPVAHFDFHATQLSWNVGPEAPQAARK